MIIIIIVIIIIMYSIISLIEYAMLSACLLVKSQLSPVFTSYVCW